MTTKNYTYYDVCFSVLVYDFIDKDKKETKRKLKRKLKYYGLGDYDEEKIEYIRKLKDEIHSEIKLENKSKYYIKTIGNVAELKDFNIEEMKSSLLKKYNLVRESDMISFLEFSVYLFYLR